MIRLHWPLVCALGIGCGGGTASDSDGSLSGGDGASGHSGHKDGGAGFDGQAGGAPGARPVVRFDLSPEPAKTPLAHVPFPNDLYRTTDGKLRLQGFPRPSIQPLLEFIIESIEDETDGFGTSASLYVAFEGGVDPTALPNDGAASLHPDASLFLVDIDPRSQEQGRRWPIYWRYDADGSDYLPPHTLAVRLVEGIALRPTTTYALIVTERAGKPSETFARMIAAAAPDEPALQSAWEAHAPLRTWLNAGHESDRPRIAGAAVFTTQDPVSGLFRIRDYVHTLPPPELVEIRSVGERQSRFWLFEGTYSAPRFQEGDIPYRTRGSGAIRFDGDTPVVQGYESLRFALTVPLGDPPPEGWPVVMYGHGTGGDFRSFIDQRVASVLARNETAAISIDQIHHGPRNLGACGDSGDQSACEGLLFFNLLVPAAGRDNMRQSAIDYVSLLRLVRALEVEPYADEEGPREVRLSHDNIMYMGHSQGGLNGPLFLAVESQVRGGMLSGAGTNFAISIEQKQLPMNISRQVAAVLRLKPEDPLDRWHPVLMLLQTFIEAGDGANYARFWFHEPPPGYRPKSIFMTIGLADPYTPPETNFALATAGRVPIIDPIYAPIEGLELLEIEPTFPPYSGNVADGRASAGLAQYENGDHFIIFTDPSARQRYGRFMLSLAQDDPPQIF